MYVRFRQLCFQEVRFDFPIIERRKLQRGNSCRRESAKLRKHLQLEREPLVLLQERTPLHRVDLSIRQAI